MIEMRRAQRSFGDGLITAEIGDLREPWMAHADAVLADEALMTTIYEALAKRHPMSRSRGRRATAAEVVLRLLILKHVRNWSYGALEREVRANLVYRDFTRVGGAKMPDAKTMGRWGTALGPQVIAQIHERMVAIARDKGVVEGRKMRVDTTVVETNIHYPTDSSLLGDGVRVLIRTMKKITKIAGDAGTRLRDRSRSVKLRVVEIARAARAKTKPAQAKLNRAYGQLLNSTSRAVGQARCFAQDIASGVKRAGTRTKQLALEGLRGEIERMAPLVRQDHPRAGGKPISSRTNGSTGWDHPRAGGETVAAVPISVPAAGPSPRGRGNPVMAVDNITISGTIPARAGKPSPTFSDNRPPVIAKKGDYSSARAADSTPAAGRC
jgi:transposase, IS5 family